MKIFFNLFCFLLLTTLVSAQKNLNINQPPAVPEVFGKGVVSTGLYERDMAISPDGNELFYTLQSPMGLFQTIVYSKKNAQGQWSAPEVAPFAGNFSDLEPAFSADGKKIYFSSNRPIEGTELKDFDIWMVEKENGTWSTPKNLGSPVNTPENEFYPSITRSGNLYYTATYKNGIGKEDIFMAKWDNGHYLDPIPMDTAVNSKMYEFNAFVSPDEDFILFTSYGRKDDMGRGDLYMSKKDANGSWMPAKNLAAINSDKLDYCPFVSFDKKILFFSSEKFNISRAYPGKPARLVDLITSFNGNQNGSGDIYWVSFDKIFGEIK